MDPAAITDLVKALGMPIETAMRLLEKFAGPAADEIGQHFGDKVRRYRFKNQLAALQKAHAIAAAAGFAPRAVPIKTLFPLLEGASLEEDDDMQRRWAALLAHAANPSNVSELPRSFISILEELSPAEAKLFDAIVDSLRARAQRWPADLTAANVENLTFTLHKIEDIYASLNPSRIPRVHHTDVHQTLIDGRTTAQKSAFRVTLGNLVRLALISPEHEWTIDKSSFGLRTGVEDSKFNLEALGNSLRHKVDFHVTTLGFEFVQACTPPPPKD